MALAVSPVAAPAREAVLGYSMYHVLVPQYVLLALPRLVQSNRSALHPQWYPSGAFTCTAVPIKFGWQIWWTCRCILWTDGLESVFLLGNKWSHRFCRRHGMVHAMGETTFVACQTLLEENELVPSLQVSRVPV